MILLVVLGLLVDVGLAHLKSMRRQLSAAAEERLEPLNRVLARDETFGQIVALDRGHRAQSQFTWQFERRWRSPDTLLLPIASVMADLICGEDWTQVKACKRSPCTLLFVDRTRDLGVIERTDRVWVSDCLDALARQQMLRLRAFALAPRSRIQPT